MLYNRPSDRWYPKNDLIIQGYYTFPVNRNFGLGPSLFNQNLQYLSHDESKTDGNVTLNFDSIILAGLSFVVTPFIKKIDKPAFFFLIDIGPAVVLNNNQNHSSDFTAMVGGYSSQVVILPLMPVHLFIMDINVVSIVRTDTPIGIMPGIRVRNQLLIKFAFLNFIDNRIKAGVKLKNIYNFMLTGNPSVGDLSNQFTYNKFYFLAYWNGLKGLELSSGYGFEYYTYANESLFFISHKFVNEISFAKKGFKLSFKHSLIFWDDGIVNGQPHNEFEVSLGYGIERF